MTDHLNPDRRSWNMAQIRSRDTAPEMRVRRIAHGLGYRYRLHCRHLPGTPDLVFPRYRFVLFVHGCFWHRHKGCPLATMPKTRVDFWRRKFLENINRDRQVAAAIRKAGWRRAVIWQCQTKNPEVIEKFLLKLKLPR
jgi:DNA mismatch endonuclease (patch repair protein)